VRIIRIYNDENGESHFEDREIDLPELSHTSQLSKCIPVAGLYFRRIEPEYDGDWHNPPRRQYIVNLDGPIEITVSDGERRIIGPGEVLYVEDMTGKGHLAKPVNDRIRHTLIMPALEA